MLVVLSLVYTCRKNPGSFTYVNGHVKILKYKKILDHFCNDREFTQSHRPEGVTTVSFTGR